MTDTDRAPRRKTPRDMQICIVELSDGSQEYAVWTTGYSLFGAGGHFQLGGGGVVGIPIDVTRWWGTYWVASVSIGIGCVGELNDTAPAPTPPADARVVEGRERASDFIARKYVDRARQAEAARDRLAARVAALEEALRKIARDRGGYMGEYHAECQQIALAALQPEEEGR